MARMYYFEQLHDGRWQIRTSWGAPRASPHQSVGPSNRRIQRVAPEHETLSLEELVAIFGHVKLVGAGA